MVEINDTHVEWAVINRLKAMLDDPPKTDFNLTLTFSLFTTIVLWSKNRAWVAGHLDRPRPLKGQSDHDAHSVREYLGQQNITEEPWYLSRREPHLVDISGNRPHLQRAAEINGDFEGMAAADFFEWLRNALAHGDGRTIRPIHRLEPRSRPRYLVGFQIEFDETRGASHKLTLSLYEVDMKRLGAQLADFFCRSLSGDDEYFQNEVGTAVIKEARIA